MLKILPVLIGLLFATKAEAMSLTVLRDRPTLQVPTSQVVEGGQGKLDLPNLVFLLDHPSGLTLIDTGYGSRFEEAKQGFPMNLFYSFVRVGEGPTVREQLKELNLRPEAVKRIILTHLHLDHVCGVVDFPEAEVYVERTEWESTRLPGFIRTSLEPRLHLLDWTKTSYEGFERSLDFYGDGRLVLVPTPGHTKGHLSLFLNLPSGKRFLLAGDVAWVEENLRRPVRKGWPMRWLFEPCWNDGPLQQVHALSKRLPELRIIPFHDPQSARTLPLPPARCE